MPNNNGGKAAPVCFNVAGVTNHFPPPPPPALVPPSMVKTEGEVCLRPAASSSNDGLVYKSPPA
eukprot:5691382-Prorocentrum_lima.AAC.1